jgi:hypothetical protein
MTRMLATARAALLLIVLSFAASSCDDATSPVSSEATPTPDLPAPTAAVSYSGIPYGPYDLWGNPTELQWGPGPFTSSLDNSSFPNSLAKRIAAARTKRIRLVLAMTAGPSAYLTNGKFDLGKWKAKLNTLNTADIRKAVADGVADGTVVGNKLIDEPESPQWGGVLTKSMIDGMASFAKSIFPTLPMGVGHGAPGFKWRSSERYKVLDWVSVQYVWNYNQGNVNAWRDEVLSFARANGVAPMFSLNLLNGGVRDRNGGWDCPNTGGKGTKTSYCRMTPDQVQTYGRAIGPSGCALLMWRYDDAFMSKSANVTAFKNVASLLNSQPRRSCKRS